MVCAPWKGAKLHCQIHDLGEIIHNSVWYCRLYVAMVWNILLGSVHLLRIFFAVSNSCLWIRSQLSPGRKSFHLNAVNVLNILNNQSVKAKRGRRGSGWGFTYTAKDFQSKIILCKPYYDTQNIFGNFCDFKRHSISFSGALAKLRKATLSFMSFRLFACKNSAPIKWIFIKFYIWEFFENE